MADRFDSVARYEAWVERVVRSPDVSRARARRLERRGRAMARRLRRMAIGGFAVLLAGLLWGLFVSPLGFAGLMLTVMAALGTVVWLSNWPRQADPTLQALPATRLAGLPAVVEDWLDSQRRAMPAPAAREVDRIMVQLDQLAPALAKLDERSPLADEAQRLLADHLPRLVASFMDVPERERRGTEALTQFCQGLRVVGAEVERITATIAKASLDALEVEGRFLDARYAQGRSVGDGQG